MTTPIGTTHSCTAMNGLTPTAKYYRVLGPNQEGVYIWWGGRWTPFNKYQLIVYKKHRVLPRVPDFRKGCFTRHEQTANDKIAEVSKRLVNERLA